jgi:hypothetical protein
VLTIANLVGRGRGDEPRQWLGVLVFENQGDTALMLRDSERPQRPRGIEIVPESHLVLEHLDVRGQWMLGCRERDDD